MTPPGPGSPENPGSTRSGSDSSGSTGSGASGHTSKKDVPARGSGPRLAQGLIIVLLAVASLGTTSLIALNKLAGRGDGQGSGGQPQYATAAVGDLSSIETGLPVLGTLPDFTLTDSQNRTVTSRDLREKICIVDFIFTRCSGACPAMTSRMAELRENLRQRPDWDRILLLSITVDPQNDTAEALGQYAKLAGADPDHWMFLTGSQEELWSLVKDGFKLPVFENPDSAAIPITHSQKFVLVDGLGRIRGYYDGQTEKGGHDLIGDLNKLVGESR